MSTAFANPSSWTIGLGLALALFIAPAMSCRGGGGNAAELATQADSGVAARLVDDITYRRGWREMHGEVERYQWMPSCSERLPEAREDRELAERLAAIGPAALPAIDWALNSVSEKVEKSEYLLNAQWLAYAYGLIRRKEALPRLFELAADRRLDSFAWDIDRAIAAALGLTGYVARPRGQGYGCGRFVEPRNALNVLASQWMRGDQEAVRRALGPAGSESLRALPAGSDWGTFWKSSWRGVDDPGAALGYQFVSDGWWLKEIGTDDLKLGHFVPANPRIEVAFFTRSGAPCGRRAVAFTEGQWDVRVGWRVDGPDVGALLGTLADCASRK